MLVLLAQPVQARVDEVALAQLVRADQQISAQALLARSNPTPVDRLFFDGLVAQHAQNYESAARLFAAAIDANPDHLNARRELAHVFFQQEKYRQAEIRFRELLRLDSADEGRKVYKAFLNEIAKRKPYGVSGYFSFLPSTNLNRGTERLVYDSILGDFVIDPASKAKSGIGVEAGISGYVRKNLRGGGRNMLNWGLSGRVYEDSYFNVAAARVGFTHEFLPRESLLIGLGVNARHIWRGDDGDNTVLGGSLTAIQALTPKDRLTVQLSYERQRFLYQPYNTGSYSKLLVHYAHQKTPSLGYHLSAELSSRRPEAAHAQYKGAQLEAGVTKSWVGGAVTGFSVFAGLRDYAGDFPLAGAPREDRIHGISASFRHNKFDVRGFVPEVSCSFYKNGSNIAFYDYTVSECNLAVTKRF